MLNFELKDSDTINSELFICTNPILHITTLMHSKYIFCSISFASYIVEVAFNTITPSFASF